MDHVQIETLQEVASRQAILTNPMRDMLAQYGPTATVETTTRITPFGNYLLNVKVVTA